MEAFAALSGSLRVLFGVAILGAFAACFVPLSGYMRAEALFVGTLHWTPQPPKAALEAVSYIPIADYPPPGRNRSGS